MSPADLYVLVRRLPPIITKADDIICRLWPKSCCRDERQHWMDWLLDHEMRGTAHAYRVWRNIQSPPMLVWLMVASGTDPHVIIAAAVDAADHRRPATQCRILRGAVPWHLVRHNLLKERTTQ